MLRRRLYLALAVLTALATPLSAENFGVPDTGPLHDDVFGSRYSFTCARGANLSQGCAAIRDRPILDATDLPWRALGRVNFASIQLRKHCTGVLVGEQIVLTAAHCLYNFARKSWIPAESLRFAAGYQRGQAVALAGVTRYVLPKAHNPKGRDYGRGPENDWAMLVLDTPLGREIGYLKPDAPEPDQRHTLRVAGYAGLRPHVLSVAEDCGDRLFEVATAMYALTCSVMPGDSGAPLLIDRDGEYRVIGVLSGTISNGDRVYSRFVSLSALFDELEAFQVP